MAVPLPFSDKEEAFLRALVEEDVRFLIVGLAAAALQGVPAVTQRGIVGSDGTVDA